MPNDEQLPLSDTRLPFVILQDEEHSFLRYLMRPHPRRQLTESPRMFSYRLSIGRRVAESVFGILAGKWRIFKPIETSDMVDKTVKCVYVLYNTVIDRKALDQSPVL